MTITFIGHGYVGLVSASIFADLGNKVWVVGHTKEKIENLKKGILPIYEPGLEEIVKRNVKAERLLFTLDYSESVPASDVIFIAVGTPPKQNGEADLSVVFEVAEKIAVHLSGYSVVATKSTVPVGTNRKIKAIIEKFKKEKATYDIASVPEFLREGQAIADTLHPDRIVIGSESKKARDILKELHKSIDGNFVLSNIETAEMIKYASNAFLATKISFANAIAALCEKTGANALDVLRAVGLDKRAGSAFLDCGAGYGGSCFPKDVKALIAIAKNAGYDFDLLRAVEKINMDARKGIIEKARILAGGSFNKKRIGVLGLSFKPDTDDMRDAPSITVINALLEEKAQIKAYDPIAMDNAKKIIKGIRLENNPYDVAKNSDLIILMTQWNEFRQLDLERIKKEMRTPIILDARNMYNGGNLKSLGFTYQGVGH
ncbi:UDP-glucose/GDP-mannose dehydrogenase family protein [Patescibacteria group bacterium]|nr:UDP-glucose/GDP-mannose dehydrogenase family protein [Patescibacteria group bacterium]MCL5010163.1 UDP-glucose/GDP-mannose dehydrogenase family protein [Patescibacteria group bacterium]